MKKLSLALVAASLLLFASHSAKADNITFSQLEAVSSDGGSTYTDNGTTRTITGVVICNPADMLNSSSCNSWVGYQWQTFIESLNFSSDFGGAALYACSDGTKMGGNTLSSDAWNSLLSSYAGLSYGDEVQVTFYATNAFEGKRNITSNHNKTSQFSVTVLKHNVTPTVSNIAISDLKNTDNRFLFDSTRASGCERYQGSLVHLTGLTVVGGTAGSNLSSDKDDWSAGNTVTVKQGDLTFDLQLGLDSTLFSSADILNAVQTSTIDITAILDQEDGGSGNSGYSLWLTNASLLSVPEPGSFMLLIAGLLGLVAYAWRNRKK